MILIGKGSTTLSLLCDPYRFDSVGNTSMNKNNRASGIVVRSSVTTTVGSKSTFVRLFTFALLKVQPLDIKKWETHYPYAFLALFANSDILPSS